MQTDNFECHQSFVSANFLCHELKVWILKYTPQPWSMIQKDDIKKVSFCHIARQGSQRYPLVAVCIFICKNSGFAIIFALNLNTSDPKTTWPLWSLEITHTVQSWLQFCSEKLFLSPGFMVLHLTFPSHKYLISVFFNTIQFMILLKFLSWLPSCCSKSFKCLSTYLYIQKRSHINLVWCRENMVK